MITSVRENPPDAINGTGRQTGYFYVMLVCPDISTKRVKLGFAKNVEKRLRLFSTVSPTIKLVKAWPCSHKNESAIIHQVTASNCKMIGREVADFDSLELLIEKLNDVFSAEDLPCHGESKYYYLPGKLAAQIEEIAKQEVRSGSYMVKKACEEFVAKRKTVKRKDST